MGTISGRLRTTFPEGPFTHDPSDQMLAAMGRFSLAWSTLEMGLDLCAVMAFHHFGGKEIEDGAAPRAMSRRIKLIRKCLNHVGLAIYRESLAHLLDSLGPTADFRQQITHGVGVADGTGNEMVFVRLIYDKSGHHTSHGELIDLEEIRTRATEAYEISRGLLGIGLALARQVAPPGFYDEVKETLP
jgi:hypothetical protein